MQTSKPAALYFKNVWTGPIAETRSALRRSLPSGALFCISFDGSSDLGVVTGLNQAEGRIATVNIMRAINKPNYDIHAERPRATNGQPADPKDIASQVMERMEAYIGFSRNTVACLWYNSSMNTAENRLRKLDKGAITEPQTFPDGLQVYRLLKPPQQ